MYKNSETYHMNRLYPLQSVILPIKINFPLSDQKENNNNS